MSCAFQVKAWRRNKIGYVIGWCSCCKRTVLQHHAVWVAAHGPIPPGLEIDHINRVRHDNRIENLRLATSSQNKVNTASSPASGHRGVYKLRSTRLRKECWMAQVKRLGITHHVGVFDTPEAAAEAREKFIAENLSY